MNIHSSTMPAKSRARTAARAFLGIFFGIQAIMLASIVVTSAPFAHAQNFGQRTIEGIVYAEDGKVLDGATVFLKNIKSHNVRSFTTQGGGVFRFAQVGMVDDYEVWAEHAKAKSAVKTVSSFDSRKELHMELKLK